jgi:hypothetical protein
MINTKKLIVMTIVGAIVTVAFEKMGVYNAIVSWVDLYKKVS